MGQTIEILKTARLGATLVVDTDRTIAGQDGEAYASAAEAAESTTYPARLAAALFAADPAIDHVFVMSNTVTLRREAWDDDLVARVTKVVTDFFLFYRP